MTAALDLRGAEIPCTTLSSRQAFNKSWESVKKIWGKGDTDKINISKETVTTDSLK